MPLTEYKDELSSDGDEIRVRFRTDRGQLVDFVAQYEATIAERAYPVVRYDGSHGRGHRDTLDPRGETIRKEWLPEHLSLSEAFQLSLQTIRDDWRRYRATNSCGGCDEHRR